MDSQRDIDQLLVKRVQAGDKDAFKLLMGKYQQKVGRIVSRLVKDPDDVDDVVQESFIKAYRAINNFRGDSAFYTWIYRIAINAAKNHLVAATRRASTPNDALDEDSETFDQTDTLSSIDTPESVLLSRQIAQTVNRCMDQLPEELKTAITLREIEGLSYEEIAKIMDCPIGTVRSRIFRARDAIAVKLSPLLDSTGDKRW
ncbi:MAG: RNA polymerase sigma factor RpoE [Burkholderiaceae bacterium]